MLWGVLAIVQDMREITKQADVLVVAIGKPKFVDESYIKELQLAAVNRNQDMREATLAAARAQSLKDAAKNPNGAANAFFGINMAENAGGGYAAAAASNRPANTNSWTCSCGETSTGNFCPKCGQPKPVSSYCPQCGKPTSGGNFCPHCGSKLG